MPKKNRLRSIPMLLNFVSKLGGTSKIYEIQRLLLAGHTQTELAARFNYSKGFFNENLLNTFTFPPVIPEEVQRVLNLIEHNDRYQLSEEEEALVQLGRYALQEYAKSDVPTPRKVKTHIHALPTPLKLQQLRGRDAILDEEVPDQGVSNRLDED